MAVDINFMIGGEAGQGVQSVGFMLAKAFARGGFHIFADQDYESRVRGGHNFYRIRVKEEKVGAISETVDVLLALNQESISLHKGEMASDGVAIFDGEKVKNPGKNDSLFSVPLERLAEETAGDKLMANTVALGAAIGLVRYDLAILERILQEHFKSEVAESNVKAARAGHKYAQENFKGKFSQHLQPVSKAKRMLLNGNEAISLGVIAAGCKFMSAYPMTPASSIMEYLASKEKTLDVVMVHAEDEIAAINMAVGAGFAGVRAMTATSGSGFCLMVEGLGLAGITETPVVIIDAQRPGPAVGLPTRTEQGDLQFAIHAHHDDPPRAVLAPTTVEDAFWTTIKAFNIAERYQLPVIILTDQHLASSHATVNPFDTKAITIDRGILFPEGEQDKPEEYQRHKVTRSGISPRAFPGQEGVLVITDSDEHDAAGHLIEDAKTRNEQMQKRLRKLFDLKREVSSPLLHGAKKAETTLIGWGSTAGAIQEAVDILHKEGLSINSLHLNELWPFPAEAVSDFMDKAHETYVIEGNATGQLSELIRAETGKQPSGRVLKFDGRPFSPTFIAQEIRKVRC